MQGETGTDQKDPRSLLLPGGGATSAADGVTCTCRVTPPPMPAYISKKRGRDEVRTPGLESGPCLSAL